MIHRVYTSCIRQRPFLTVYKPITRAFMTVEVQETVIKTPPPPPSPSSLERPAKKARMEPPPAPPVLENEAELVEEQMGLPVEFTRTYHHEVDYRNKLVLAPMVRTGSCE